MLKNLKMYHLSVKITIIPHEYMYVYIHINLIKGPTCTGTIHRSIK